MTTALGTPTAQESQQFSEFDTNSLVIVVDEDSRHSLSASSLRDSMLEDELTQAKDKLAEMTRVCHELQFQVKQLEAAKLLWDVTRLGMEFQVIKDKDNHNRVRNRLEDELVRAQLTAKYFQKETEKLKEEMEAKDDQITALDTQVKLLQSNNDMHLRIKQLEAQVQQLTTTNKALIDENHVLKLQQYELEQEVEPVPRSSSWRLFQKGESKGITLLKRMPTMNASKANEIIPPARAPKSTANHELIKLLKRELRASQRDSLDVWF